MKMPIEMMLDKDAVWTATGTHDPNWKEGDMPYATHEGTITLLDVPMRCTRLNTGQSVINGEDIHKLFEILGDSV